MFRKDVRTLYTHSRRAALCALLVSLALGGAKLAGGLCGHSIALLSDAVHSLGDALASGSVWAALIWAQQPADREHPYGHTRAESVAGLSVALLLILSGIWVGWEALSTLAEPSPPPEWYTLAIAAVSVFLNEGLYQYSSRVARRTGSRALLAASWDQRVDALASLGVLVALAISWWGGPQWQAADRIAALAVAVVILWVGGGMFWGSLHELMDAQAPADVLASVRREAMTVSGVQGVEKLFVRKAGLEYLVDIHVEVDPALTVAEGHAIAHAVKDRLMEQMLPVKDVLVHIEPAPARPAGVSPGGNHG